MSAKDTKSREKLYGKIYKLHSDNPVEAAVVATASMPDTVGTVEVFDKNGTSLGYVAVYANSDLS